MGYDMKITDGKELTLDIAIFRKGEKQTNRKFKLNVEKGDEIYYEFYVKDGDYDTC